jgi:hypothetical protein
VDNKLPIMMLLTAEHPKYSQLILMLIALLLVGVQVTIPPLKVEVGWHRIIFLLLTTEALLPKVMILPQPLTLHQVQALAYSRTE